MDFLAIKKVEKIIPRYSKKWINREIRKFDMKPDIRVKTFKTIQSRIILHRTYNSLFNKDNFSFPKKLRSRFKNFKCWFQKNSGKPVSKKGPTWLLRWDQVLFRRFSGQFRIFINKIAQKSSPGSFLYAESGLFSGIAWDQGQALICQGEHNLARSGLMVNFPGKVKLLHVRKNVLIFRYHKQKIKAENIRTLESIFNIWKNKI